MEGRGETWELVPAQPCSPCSVLVNLLFHVLGGAILITNYIIPRVDIGLAANENTRLENKKCLSDEYKFILIIYRGFACNLTMGVFHVEMGSNRVYTMRMRGEANIRDTALVALFS